MTEETKKPSRLAAWAETLRNAPDDRGAGIGRTLVLSVVVGIFAGLGAIALVSMLHFFDWLFLGKIAGVALGGPAHEPQPFNLPEAAGPVRRWAVALLPAFGGLVTGWFVQRFAPEAAGHGTDAAIEAYHFRGGRVRPVAIPVKALATSDDPNEASLPFDKRRAGFVPAEGAGALVLEEYEHAKARGAKIYGEIVGYGTTCDAYHITAPKPDGTGAGKAVALALEEAGWKPGEQVYVNAHGTGTSLNDLAETLALKLAFGEEEARQLQISSTKSMTGHMLGAAGAVEAIVCAKALAENVMPPTINLLERDPDCDLDYIPLVKREGKIDLAISNSFGFGGHNACVAIRRCE